MKRTRKAIQKYNRRHAAELGFVITGLLICLIIFFNVISGNFVIVSAKVLDATVMLTVILGGACFGRFIFLCKFDN